MQDKIENLINQNISDAVCTFEGDACNLKLTVISKEFKDLSLVNQHRKVFTEIAGVTQPNPSPRFSRTKEEIQGPPAHPGQDTDEVLSSAGYDSDDILKLRDVGAVA